MSDTLLSVENLRVTYPTRKGPAEVVRGVSFTLGRERLAIVGESGSGKSQTGRAILGLTPKPGIVTADKLSFDGIDLRGAKPRQWRALRGARMSMVMQDPKFSLNPVMTVGAQIMEALAFHGRTSRAEKRDRALARALGALKQGHDLGELPVLVRVLAFTSTKTSDLHLPFISTILRYMRRGPGTTRTFRNGSG